MKVMTILGTRPEIIRLCSVIKLLEKQVRHVLVHTGQNTDYELNEVFFKDLGLRSPDHFLGIDRSSLGSILGQVLERSERVMREERPDAVLLLGDTNSAFAGIMARRMKIPLYHMEAGNRCFDLNVPEETNRRIIDHVSDVNLVYTEHARRNLLAEGLPPRRIHLTGSPMFEVIQDHRHRIAESRILEQLGLHSGGFLLASFHRAENVDLPARLADIVRGLNALCAEHQIPVVVTTHPRTRQKLDSLAASTPDLVPDPRIRFLKPFGYFDYLRLQTEATCTVSDSGTISEEGAILGFPAVTIRNSIERPEAMDSGHIIVCGLSPASVVESVRCAVSTAVALRSHPIPAEYSVPNVSHRVLRLILGTHSLVHGWQGIVTA